MIILMILLNILPVHKYILIKYFVEFIIFKNFLDNLILTPIFPTLDMILFEVETYFSLSIYRHIVFGFF